MGIIHFEVGQRVYVNDTSLIALDDFRGITHKNNYKYIVENYKPAIDEEVEPLKKQFKKDALMWKLMEYNKKTVEKFIEMAKDLISVSSEEESSIPVLDQLLAQVTDDNIHKEVDWGKPVGKEIW